MTRENATTRQCRQCGDRNDHLKSDLLTYHFWSLLKLGGVAVV
jgi:hypothetical protein